MYCKVYKLGWMGFTLDFLTTGNQLFVSSLVASAKMNTAVAAVCSC